ncbi:MAG: hypothetical protein ACKOMX_01565 [Actinomycetota bacterium]
MRQMALLMSAMALVGVCAAPAASANDSVVCRIADERLTEISGLAYSPTFDGIIWTHNDSGGGPKLYALDSGTCETVAVLTLRGLPAKDFEAMAAGVNVMGERVLWVADIGDNTASRATVSIYEVREPKTLRSSIVNATRYAVRYSTPQDAEALVADPGIDQLWIISKGLLGGSVFELPRPLWPRGVTSLRKIGEERGFVTDAAMAPDGSRYAVRDYTNVRIYRGQPPGKLIADLVLPEQVQGEALTWTPDGRALLVASESDDRLLRVDLPQDAWMRSALPDSPQQPVAAESAAGSPVNAAVVPADRVGTLAVIALAVGAGVFVIACLVVAIAAAVRRRREEHVAD